MKRTAALVITSALALAASLVPLGQAQDDWTQGLPPCQVEDDTDCYWDAQTMGNGQGRSYVNVDGVITYR